MFGEINRKFNKAKSDILHHRFIVESVLDVEEVLPGSEEEIDDEIDVDSVPDDVYKEIDKKLDELISRGNYDDEEIEQMVDDDDPEDDEVEIEIKEAVNEAVDAWVMKDEGNHWEADIKLRGINSDDDDDDDEEDDDDDDDEEDEINEEVSYGSGEEVDIQNKTGDYREGDHVKEEDKNPITNETFANIRRLLG